MLLDSEYFIEKLFLGEVGKWSFPKVLKKYGLANLFSKAAGCNVVT